MNALRAQTVQVRATPKRKNSPVAAARLAQRPDKEGKRRAAGARAREGAKDHRRVEHHDPLSEPPEMNAQPGRAIPLSIRRQQFRRMRDMGGDVGKPGIEQIEKDANAGEQEYRR